VARYNADRPHQSLGMATPAERFSATQVREESAASEPSKLDVIAGEGPQTPPQPTSVHKVIRKADSAGSFGFATARYSAGRWLAGRFVTVRRVGDIVEVHYEGQLVKVHPRKHAKEKEETMSRQKRTLGRDACKAG
jgi:hypothetical protein